MQSSKQSNLSFYQNNTKSPNRNLGIVKNTTFTNFEICKKTVISRRIKREKRALLLIKFTCKQQLREKISFETASKICKKINNRYEESKIVTNNLIEEIDNPIIKTTTKTLNEIGLTVLINSLKTINSKINESRFKGSLINTYNLQLHKKNILHQIKILFNHNKTLVI